MSATCLQCGRIIEIQPGHRPRRYCNDECKQTAYRRRHGAKARQTRGERETYKVVREIMQLEKEYPGFSFGTYYVLQQIQTKSGRVLASKTAERIRWEINHVQQS